MMQEESPNKIADVVISNEIYGRKAAFRESPIFVHEKGSSPYLNLQQLALAVTCHRPVLLCGPVGCGKTSSVEYLALRTGHELKNSENVDISDSHLFLKVQLGEHTDSRMLLGGYQCTEIPGQFVWKPGILTQAVINGYWLLLEDIDCASSDLITIIQNLVKTQFLSIPGYGNNIIPHNHFQLFATQRSQKFEFLSKANINNFKHWSVICLRSLTSLEIVAIITKKFPRLASIASRLVSIMDIEFFQNPCGNRLPSVRDILKWCSRCNEYFQSGSLESILRIFHDAIDIFCGFIEKDLRFKIANQIGFKLGIVENKANFVNINYKPNIILSENELIAGRAHLKRNEKRAVFINKLKNDVFSLNTQSCCLIEKICCSLENNEPVLLVGETGCGKTTVLQYIADVLGKNLVVINMNQQSDTVDLLGGFKPVSFKVVMKPFCDYFETQFRDLFNVEKNRECLIKYAKLIKNENWEVLIKFMTHVQKRAMVQIDNQLQSFIHVNEKSQLNNSESDRQKWQNREKLWKEIGKLIMKHSKQRLAAEQSLIFSFVEGSLVKALEKGDWVLLDEINLASSDTLDCLNGLLENPLESISLLEKGESQPVHRNPGFRLFAAMNPATDVGKKQLPLGLRNRFTEFYIDELDDFYNLSPLVETYLSQLNLKASKIKKIVMFYLHVKNQLKDNVLNASGKKPHFSLRNLCRALSIASRNPCGSFSRSIFESLSVSFLTQLDSKSYDLIKDLIINIVMESNIKAIFNQAIPKPSDGNYIKMEGFWLRVGTLVPSVPENYILTPTVQRHLRDLIKIVSLGSGIPVLLEGDTSVGKTSLINYLAKCTGNICARVNNHEHTDIQEYIGTYVADSDGKLVFKEGILCEAMRKGHWIILDELNLAPTEVLEALNRVLDDNRELFIPETQNTIKAHEQFLLFATQNPTGIYGGRKELSRAFRNRFIELQFNQIPPNELATILEKRCSLPTTYCKKMVSVMTDLQLRRRGSDIFIGKSGFITLRDLFRWGERYHKAQVDSNFYDWEQHLAYEGYMLLAGRVRNQDESKIIEEIIAKYFKVRPDPRNLFSLHKDTSPVSREILTKLINYSDHDKDFRHIVWTYSMRRLAVLVCKALQFSEPVLIVGETGCGKTSVVQMLAKINEQKLYSVNCHMHSEGADFLGGLRPVRNNDLRASGILFEWCDGPLIHAMATGSIFLADEISLADDSVLERLNSLLEPERTILLAEKGGELLENDNEEYTIVAEKDFQFIGTMNPGGDYGKKELSPALRNRFTEIWADTTYNKFDCFFDIIRHNLDVPENQRDKVARIMTNLLKWFQNFEVGKRIIISYRDLITWTSFMKATNLPWYESCIHGIFLTFLDGLECGSRIVFDRDSINNFKKDCIDYFIKKCSKVLKVKQEVLFSVLHEKSDLQVEENRVVLHPFYIPKGSHENSFENYIYTAPTTFSNVKKLFRNLTMKKAILLEGSPGVGKTSLVSSLAKATGHKMTRINLSEQTDISDLFGADLPEEEGKAGSFVWRDGPFLTALKEGHWILLDELNLASQSVLEGLNAALDHRGSVYLPELDKTFYLSQETRIFGCQNPLTEGGNRRGLPNSFLNRFSLVFIDPLTESDYRIILKELFQVLYAVEIKGKSFIQLIIDFTSKITKAVSDNVIGIYNGPLEFNLRDLVRLAEGVMKDVNWGTKEHCNTHNFTSTFEYNLIRVTYKYVKLLYSCRFRSEADRKWIDELFTTFFGDNNFVNERTEIYITNNTLFLGNNVTNVNNLYFYGDIDEFEMFVSAKNHYEYTEGPEDKEILRICSTYHGKRKFQMLRLLEKEYLVLSFLCQCVNMNWLPILVGDSGAGKTSCIHTLAALKGEKLRIMACNSAMDTMEILGGFEQADFNRHLEDVSESCKVIVLSAAKRYLNRKSKAKAVYLIQKWAEYMQMTPNRDENDSTSVPSNEFYQIKINFLKILLENDYLQRDEDIQKLISEVLVKLEELSETLASSDCLSFGGKFEWVDSVLVKALKEGSWLLMEDVNLCSNAVLDRLNGLLEPGGSLTVGERGTGKDGKIITLTPHPNFRLFFTMDPNKGQISRAMKNRGVEIYMSLDREISCWPKLDLISLLSDSGVRDMDTQNALIQIESKADDSNVSNLVFNGFWSSQYIKQGFSYSEAVLKATSQIYRFSEIQLEELTNHSLFKLNDGKKEIFDISFARPEMDLFIVDSMYARLKQSCALFRLIVDIKASGLNCHGSLPSNVVKYFFSEFEDNKNVSLLTLAEYNLFHIFLSSSVDVLLKLKNFLKPILSELSDSKLINRMEIGMKLLNNVVTKLKSDTQYPWDPRWFENVYRYLTGNSYEFVNNHLVLMKFRFSDLNEVGSDTFGKSLTVKKYSFLVEEGHLEDICPNYSFVSYFNKCLTNFDKLTNNIIIANRLQITDEEATWFFDVLKWKLLLQKQGDLVLLSENRIIVEDTLTMLALHFNWFYKSFINELDKLPNLLLQEGYSALVQDLKLINLSQDYSHDLIKICNDFRKCLSHLSPNNYLPIKLNSVSNYFEISDADSASQSFKITEADPVIMGSILNDFIEYFILKISFALNDETINEYDPDFFTKLLSLLTFLSKEVKYSQPCKSLLEKYRASNPEERRGLVTELFYFSLRILNRDYSFKEEKNDEINKLYLNQILPYHRPVWTNRILNLVFNNDDYWNLSNYKKSQNDFKILRLTVFPNSVVSMDRVTKFKLFDFSLNSKTAFEQERDKVIEAVKKVFKINENGFQSLDDLLNRQLEKSSRPSEKNFFTRLKRILNLLSSLDLGNRENHSFDCILGCCWLLLGLLELLFFNQGKIDPIRKKLIKIDYAKNEKEETEAELLALELHSSITGISLNHFYVKNLKYNFERAKNRITKYEFLEKIKRSPESFKAITDSVESFITSIDEIIIFCENILNFNNRIRTLNRLYQIGSYFVIKTKGFCGELEKFVTFFGDVTYPILAALAQVENGLNSILSDLASCLFSVKADGLNFFKKLGQYPVDFETDFLQEFDFNNFCDLQDSTLEKIRESEILLMFSSYLIVYNAWFYTKSQKRLRQMNHMFSNVAKLWQTSRDKLKEKEIEKDNLYVKREEKKRKISDEEEEMLNQRLKLFPTFDCDFSDEKSEEQTNAYLKFGSLNEDQFIEVSRLHMNIMKNGSTVRWQSNQSKLSSPLMPDLVTPLCLRFGAMYKMMPFFCLTLNKDLDDDLLPGLLVLMQAKESSSLSTEMKLFVDPDRLYDFYRDKNVEEVKKSLGILQELKEKIEIFLKEWPEHPTLIQINNVIEKILEFSIESPVMRFLNGLELLLKYCQDWESVANDKVSIADTLLKMTNLIVEWRQMELKGWKKCLTAADARMKTEAYKWWFHFWHIIEEYFSNKNFEEAVYFHDTMKSITSFLELSPTGEFDVRLDIVLSYHYHLLNLPGSEKRDKLCIALWNIYSFYQQFKGEVAKKLQSDSAPVFKKQLEFVKIAKWYDVTYWSVKQSIEKSHRTLFKCIKEYEELLKKTIDLKSLDLKLEFIDDKNNLPKLETATLLREKQFAINEEAFHLSERKFEMRNVRSKLLKAFTFSNKIIKKDLYSVLLSCLDDLTIKISESIEHFQNLKVNEQSSLSKRRSQAKSIIHQKRRALMDLFKVLQEIGVSYRAGLTQNQFGVLELCNGPPMNHAENQSDSANGEFFFLRFISKRLQLINFLLSPSKEIGPRVIERLSGCSAHLMEVNAKQRIILNEATVNLECLKKFYDTLTALTKISVNDFYLVNQSKFSIKVKDFKNLLMRTQYRIDEFLCLLNSWPESDESQMKFLNYSGGDDTPDIFMASKLDVVYIDAQNKFCKIKEEFAKIKFKFENHFSDDKFFKTKFRKGVIRIFKNRFQFYISSDVDFYNNCIDEYERFLKSINDFIKIFKGDYIMCRLTIGLEEIEKLFEHFQKYTLNDSVHQNKRITMKNHTIKLVDNLMKSCLLGMQRMIKKSEQIFEILKSDPEYGKHERDLLLPLKDHLTEKLTDSLASDFILLNMAKVNKILSEIFDYLSCSFTDSDVKKGTSKIHSCLYTAMLFLKQFFVLCKYFVRRQEICFKKSTRFSCTVLNVFTIVAKKGFCTPSEFEPDCDEGDEWFNDNEGGGFTGTEGQGQKDVSDKIENEDQLEDAKPSGSEKDEPADKDCQEEEKGIEMSENFDGKAQNVNNEETNESDENSESENEEGTDMEMGEAENGGDKLESEMWSDSNDEDENEDDGTGKGKEISKDDYAANEDDEGNCGEENPEKKRKKQERNLNDMENSEDDDQIDPYHGNHESYPEPEALELPEDMQLDEGEAKNDDNKEEENPFDIDVMKEQQLPMDVDENKVEDESNNGIDEEPKCESESESETKTETENKKDDEEIDDDVQESNEDSAEGEEFDEKKSGAEDERKENDAMEGIEEKESEQEMADAVPSNDKPSEAATQSAPETKLNDKMSQDQVVENFENDSKQFEPQEAYQDSKAEAKGTGQAQIEGKKGGHEANLSNKEKLKSGESQTKRQKKRERPGKSDDDRCLGDEKSTYNKKLKTINESKEEKDRDEGQYDVQESEIYQHVSEKIREAAQVLDAATKEQSKTQSIPENNQEEDKEIDENVEEIEMDVDEENVEKLDDVAERKSSSVENSENKSKNLDGEKGDGVSEDVRNEIEGDLVETLGAKRGPETTFHSNPTALDEEKTSPLQPEDIEILRLEIQRQLQVHNAKGTTSSESARTWQLLLSAVDCLARDLSEKLRIILEPTRATRLKGDYRTGRRINMKKVISYVASEFRKDCIWLRRTKPWKRDHEIILALDDSHSMFHNESRELAFESLALVFRALELIEAGRLGVLSFGEKTKVVHRLEEPFSIEAGAKIIEEFTFEQKKTLLCDMLELSTTMMVSDRKENNVAQLLLIISDGRGVFSEGLEKVRMAVRRATDFGIFIVFIIIDNPKSKDSIMDIRMPEFSDGKFLGMKSYMENFPFPFYMVVRDIAALPNILSDALRQWFSLITCNISN